MKCVVDMRKTGAFFDSDGQASVVYYVWMEGKNMILFQINATDRQFMRKYLTQYFGLGDFMVNANLSDLSLRNLSENPDVLKNLFLSIREYLYDLFPSVFSLGEEYLENRAACDAFFWDTIIALFCQLKYSESKSTSIREFYNSNLSNYGVKYNSYTGYFKEFIFSQPIGEFIGIKPLHTLPEKIQHIPNVLSTIVFRYSNTP